MGRPVKRRAHWFVQVPKADPPGFGLLPFRLRATALMMLRVADESGRISLGGMEPGEAVVRLCGAAGRERPWLRSTVERLLEARAFVVDGASLVATDWASQVWPEATLPPMGIASTSEQPQGKRRATTEQSQGNHQSTTGQSQGNHRAITNKPPSNHRANKDKPSESLGASETSIIEEDNNNTIDIKRGSRGDDLTDAAVVRSVVERWLASIGQPTNLGGFSSQTLINESLGSLRAVAESEGVSLDRATGRTLLGFEADDWAKAHGYPLGAWARRPAKYLPLWRQANEKRERARRLAELESQSEEVSFGTEEERLSAEETSARVEEILGKLGKGFSMGAA